MATFTLASARLPPKLAERLSRLRDDEEARDTLDREVYEHRRELQKKHSERAGGPSPRQGFVQQLAKKDAAGGLGGDILLQQQVPPKRSPRSGRRAVADVQPQGVPSSLTASTASVVVPSYVSEAYPPLGGSNEEPWFRGTIVDRIGQTAAETIEKARGHRVRDPLEVAGTGASVVRRREKGLELGGAFRTGKASSEAERLATIASACALEEGPREVYDALPGGGAGSFQASVDRAGAAASLRDAVNVGITGHLAAASWLGGDFVRTKIDQSTMSDTALLDGHRAPYVDGTAKAQQTGRHRNRAKEVSPRVQLPSDMSALDPWRGIRPAREAAELERADGRSGQIDSLEMQTQRMLVSSVLFRCR